MNSGLSVASRRIILKTLQKYAQQYWGNSGAGILFICSEDNTCLLALRSSGVNEPGTWGVPGGAIEKGESPEIGAEREVKEEFGSLPSSFEEVTRTKFKSDNDFEYTTFIYDISKDEKRNWSKRIKLNWENDQFKWFDFSTLPSNLHFGVQKVKQLLVEQSNLFLFPERKNNWDHYRNILSKLKTSVKKENQQIFNSLISELENPPQTEGREQLVNYSKLISDKMLDLSKSLSSAGEEDIAKKIEVAANSIVKELDRDMVESELVSKEQATDKFLYHGTNFGDVLSLLTTKTFQPTGTYKKVSLTTSFDLALKFGDTVLAFDADKLKAKGARKMQYGTTDEVAKANSEGRDEDSLDHPEGPIILDIYKYEQEWSIRTPFSFDLQDLDRIYFVCDPNRKYGKESNTYDEAMDLVHSIVGDEVPLVCSSIKATAPFYPDQSSRVSSGIIGLKSFLFTNILRACSDLKDIRLEYFKIMERHGIPNEYIKYDRLYSYLNNLISLFNEMETVKNDLNFSYVNKDRGKASVILRLDSLLSRILGSNEMSEGESSQNSLTGISEFTYREYSYSDYSASAQKEIEAFVENLNEYIKALISELKNKVSFFKQTSSEAIKFSDKESLYPYIFNDISLPPFLKSKLYAKSSSLFSEIYNDYLNGNLSNYGDDYRIKNRLESLAEKAPPDAIPTELLKDRPIILIDHINPDLFSDQQIKDALSSQDNYNADWIFNYRYGFDKTKFPALDDAKKYFEECEQSYPGCAKDTLKSIKDIKSKDFYMRVFKVLGRQDLINDITDLIEFLEQLSAN